MDRKISNLILVYRDSLGNSSHIVTKRKNPGNYIYTKYMYKYEGNFDLLEIGRKLYGITNYYYILLSEF
jgi:hypothetical protein